VIETDFSVCGLDIFRIPAQATGRHTHTYVYASIYISMEALVWEVKQTIFPLLVVCVFSTLMNQRIIMMSFHK